MEPGVRKKSWPTKRMIIKAMIICTVIASVIYILFNIFAPLQWPAYNSIRDGGNFGALGVPTRRLWAWLCAPYLVITIAFIAVIWKSSSQNYPLRIAAVLMIVYGVLCFIWLFAPIIQPETPLAVKKDISSYLYFSLGLVTQIIYLSALGFSVLAFGKWFGLYAIAIFAVLLVFGVLIFIVVPVIIPIQPTPPFGIWERLNICIFLLWAIVLALTCYGNKK
jgi:hypothetical protein